jgi:carbon monoxide dehydrogenase subunit G
VKFKVSDDVEAPVDWVWAGFTDFAAIEADIRAREADLSRVGDWKEAALGVAWRGSVPVRGKHRTIDARIAGFVPEERLLVESQIGGMACTYEVTFAPLSAGGSTRVSVTLELKASTLSARLLLQTLKIARRKVIQRLDGAVVRQGQAVEADWRARAGA